MSYTPTTWTTGDTITATALNKIENGIASAGGYDAEVSVYGDSLGLQLNVISGSFASLSALLNNNISPVVLVRLWFENYSGYYTKSATTAVSIYSYNLDGSAPYIFFSYKVPTSNTVGTYSSEWMRMTFSWFSDDTLED